MLIRLLDKKDAHQYFTLQFKSSEYSSNSFYKSNGESVSLETIQKVLKRLPKDSFRFGAFDNDKLIGLICFNRNNFKKLNHKAKIFGFFIYPKYRNQGIGKSLLSKTLDKASKIEKLEAITLSVFNESKNAIVLYKKFGFKEIGRETLSMKTNSGYVDELFMKLELKNLPSAIK